jgi:hypothetical protein
MIVNFRVDASIELELNENNVNYFVNMKDKETDAESEQQMTARFNRILDIIDVEIETLVPQSVLSDPLATILWYAHGIVLFDYSIMNQAIEKTSCIEVDNLQGQLKDTPYFSGLTHYVLACLIEGDYTNIMWRDDIFDVTQDEMKKLWHEMNNANGLPSAIADIGGYLDRMNEVNSIKNDFKGFKGYDA